MKIAKAWKKTNAILFVEEHRSCQPKLILFRVSRVGFIAEKVSRACDCKFPDDAMHSNSFKFTKKCLPERFRSALQRCLRSVSKSNGKAHFSCAATCPNAQNNTKVRPREIAQLTAAPASNPEAGLGKFLFRSIVTWPDHSSVPGALCMWQVGL